MLILTGVRQVDVGEAIETAKRELSAAGYTVLFSTVTKAEADNDGWHLVFESSLTRDKVDIRIDGSGKVLSFEKLKQL